MCRGKMAVNHAIASLIIFLFILRASQQSQSCARWQFSTWNEHKLKCIDCFCNGVTSRCRRAIYFITKIMLQDVSRVKAVTDDVRLPDNAIYYTKSNEVILGDMDGLGNSVVYWVLPSDLHGYQVFSYGGYLEYTVFYDVLTKSVPYRSPNVIIKGGNGESIIHNSDALLYPKITEEVRIQIIEDNFRLENGNKATRNDVMRILLNIKEFLIRATYAKDTRVTLLNSVSIDTASPYYTRFGRTKYIEQCLCPAEYHGFSCEGCQRGFTKHISSTGQKTCVRCNCNRHSLECNPENGICKKCQDNTKGDHCEACKDGYYGDAQRGTTEDCRKCACPLSIKSNQFSPTCEKVKNGQVRCTACREGYTGMDCGECAKGYAGNPRYPGGKCIKSTRRADRMPNLSVKPKRRTDPLGYRTTFRCKVIGIGPFHVTWSRRDARPLPVGRSRVLSRNNEWILIISSLRVEDGGDYACSARNRYGIASHKVSVQIYVNKAPSIKVHVTPTTLRITEGSSAIFLCNIGKTQLLTHTRTWSRDGYRLLPDRAEVIDGTLVFRNTQKEDSGVYTCTASNQVSIDSATVILSVGALIPPQISLWPLTQTVDVGHPVKFQCTAAGFPRPEVFWSRTLDDEDEEDGEEGTYLFSGNGALRIVKAGTKDEGEYHCTARNKAGEATRKAILYVRAPNRRLSISVYPERKKALVGEKVVFKCASSGQPEPSIRWSVRKGQTVLTQGGTLTLYSVEVEDSGFYLCTASNPYGSVSAKVKLTVVERPKRKLLQVSIVPASLTVEEGESAFLQCNVSDQFTKLTWSKSNGLLSDNHIVDEYGLNITKATMEDGGIYICVASRKGEIARASTSVIVQGKTLPKVTIQPENVRNASIGEKVHFRCTVSGEQPVENIVWHTESGILLVNGKSRLNNSTDLVLGFDSVDKKNEGKYFCAAVNKAGFAKASAILKVSGKPSLTLTPRGVYNATAGDDVIFECKATGFPVPNVEWILPEGAPTAETTVTSWPGYARIEMNAVSRVNGKYTCKASNEEGEDIDWVLMKVNSKHLQPSVTVRPADINAIAGQLIRIECQPFGIPTPEFAWVKLRKNARSIVISKRNILVMEDVQVSSEGQYACRAWNKLGTVEAKSILRVSTLPVVEVDPTSVVVLSGRSFYINCKVNGYPMPTVNWTFPKKEVASVYVKRNGALEVQGATSEHTGIYKCVAKNDGGIVERSVNVTVLVPPKIISSSGQENVARLGENIIFFCNATGFPEPRIKWQKDGALLLAGDGPKLNLTNLTIDSQGQYQCVASNVAGQVEEIFSLAIEEIPTANILEDTGTGLKTVPVGTDITLNCISSGNPEPVLRWTKPDGKLPGGFLVEGGQLRIFNSSVEDSGTFRCSAFNSIGYVHADIRIFVQGAPIVEVSPKSSQVQVGKELRLSCSATGMPRPSVTWKKISGTLPPHYIEKDQLIIPKVRGSDGGEYICTATNTRGSAEGHVKLRVTDFLPRFSEDGQSYIIYGKILGALYQIKIEISFRPENSEGILLYNGKSTGDFVSLGILKGYVVFQYNLGSGPAFIRSHKKIDLFKWHTVVAYRDGLDGTLAVDADPIVYGKSKGKYTGLNLNGDLFLGGHANLDIISKQVVSKRGFSGCISQLVIAGNELKLGEDSLMMVGISDCNICLTQPCKHDGLCLPSASRYGYKCECHPGFTGNSCEDRVARCFPGACGEEGVCSDTENSEFKCKCPIGSYGARCQFGKAIKTPSFKNSFLTFSGIKGAWEELHIILKFKPRANNGLLLHNGGLFARRTHTDYVSIKLINGYVQFEFNAGTGSAVIRHSERVLLNEWNSIEVERYRRYGSISVNGKIAQKGTSLGISVTLNLGPALYIGGIDEATRKHNVNQSGSYEAGFNGCIQEIIINGQNIDLVRDFVSSQGITDCYSKLTPCSPSMCQNNATCQVVSAVTYKCICPLRYYGKHCESFSMRCGDVDNCENGGSCERDGDANKMSCHCNLGFTGKACEKAIKLGKEALFQGDGYLQFPRHVLRKVELTSLQFDLKTNEDNSLVFWFGEEKDSSKGKNPDFISVGLKNGFLEVSYELGSGLAVMLSKTPVNDRAWHTVRITRSAKKASLLIDGVEVAHTKSRGINTHLDIEAPMFVGGGKNVASLTGQKYKKSFTGCIGNLLVEDQSILLQDMAEDGKNIHPCTESSI